MAEAVAAAIRRAGNPRAVGAHPLHPLLKYPVAVDKPEQPIRLLDDGAGDFFVAQTALRGSTSENAAPDHTKEFNPEATDYRMQGSDQSLRIPLHWSDGNGLEVTKVYTFHRDSYAIDVDFEIKNGTDKVWQGTAYRQLQRSNPGKGSRFSNPTYTGAAISSDEKKYEKVSFDKMGEENLSRDIKQGWVAMMQHYFVSAWVPVGEGQRRIYSLAPGNNRYVIGMYDQTAVAVQPGQTAAILAKLFVGPKLPEQLEALAPNLDEGVFQPLLEELSGKVCGRDFGWAYNPEFIALGSIIHNFLNPDLVLIGASDMRSGGLIRELYVTTCINRPAIAVMSLINAEVAKLSLNCFVTLKISFANELAALCERLPGAEVDVITQALGADRRIGPKYLKGGLGFGGPCFPRDNLAFQALAREAAFEALLSPQVVAVNDGVVARLLRLITDHTPPPGPVALLGLASKPDTPIVEESQALKLAWELVMAGYHVRVHDPQALSEAPAR